MKKAPKATASPLKAHIGYRMRIVSNAVSFSFAKKLADSKVTVAEWVLMREMYSEERTISPSMIADITGLTRGAISKLVERLLQKGLVSRTDSVTDRRYQEIKLTKKAVELVPNLAKIADENDEKFFSVLSASERNTLISLLVKIADKHQLNKNPIE